MSPRRTAAPAGKTPRRAPSRRDGAGGAHPPGLGALASALAHELRNPLGVILLSVGNIRRKSAPGAFDAQLAGIERKVEESGRVIDAFLSYARIAPPRFARVAIAALVEECIDAARGRHARPGIAVGRDLGALRGRSVEADAGQLERLFGAVLDNAYESIAGRRGRIGVRGSFDPASGAVTVRVTDSGCGIHPGDLPRIREPFFTTKGRGRGLGLSACERIAGFHGASISVSSAPGRGAVVAISIPSRSSGEP